MRKTNNILWQDKESDIQYIIDRLIKIIFKMHSQHFYLKNLTLENIVFELDSSERLHLKIIDL